MGVGMYHIAIVEDEEEFSTQLQEFLKKYQKEQKKMKMKQVKTIVKKML